MGEWTKYVLKDFYNFVSCTSICGSTGHSCVSVIEEDIVTTGGGWAAILPDGHGRALLASLSWVEGAILFCQLSRGLVPFRGSGTLQ